MTKFKIGEKVKFFNWVDLPDLERSYKNRTGTIIERKPYEITVRYKDGFIITGGLSDFTYVYTNDREKETKRTLHNNCLENSRRYKKLNHIQNLIDSGECTLTEPNFDPNYEPEEIFNPNAYEERKRKLKKSKTKRLVKKTFKKSFKKSFKK